MRGGGPSRDVDGGPDREEEGESVESCGAVDCFVEDSASCCLEERVSGGEGEELRCDLSTSVEAEGVLVERDGVEIGG